MKEVFEEILNNYEKNDGDNEYYITSFKGKFIEQFKSFLIDFLADDYKIKTTQMNNYTFCPWCGIFNTKITEDPKKGYYIVVIFKNNMKGFFLSLMFGTNNFEDDDSLKNKVLEFRSIISNNFNISEFIEMDLKQRDDGKKCEKSEEYKKSNILSFEYNISDVNDENFENNFKANVEYLIKIYDYLISIKSNKENVEIENPKNNLKKQYSNLFLNAKKMEDIENFIPNNKINHICAALNSGNHIIFNGMPGTGKTELAIKFSEASFKNNFNSGYILTTATSDWSTFDTIGGLLPVKNGSLEFHPGKFLEAIKQNKWLIIDEINRADIDKAFGQLFTVLSSQNVELPYKIDEKPVKIEISNEYNSFFDGDTSTFFIGKNWRIIGTMNVDDKDSLFNFSYAFMRRFMFIEIDLPEENDYKELISKWSEDLDEYSHDLNELYNIVSYRRIGPAIFKDMINYIKCRNKLSDDNKKDILNEAISSYILPQLEGLDKIKLKNIQLIFSKLDLDDLNEKIDELIPDFV